MSVIHKLSQSIINKIAAGEVIERPASAVKELMENALDAKSTRIDVYVDKGGSDLIRVTDNGGGIAADQLPLAVAPHATSKIQDADDLFRVGTMGFRGEALASIAEISRFRIKSREPNSNEGAQLEVLGGEVGEVAPCGCPVGTTVEVLNLFCNTPVRKKYLKSVSTEFGYVSEQFYRVAIPHPEIAFTLSHNGKNVADLPAVENQLQRLVDVFGRELAESLIWVKSQNGNVAISGFVAQPSVSRANNKAQYLFLNGRFIRDKSLQHALQEAYRGLMMVGRFPVAFLQLEMPFDMVDVNVHPTKLEVRFQDAPQLYSILLSSIRQKFLTSDLRSKVNFPSPEFGENPRNPLYNREYNNPTALPREAVSEDPDVPPTPRHEPLPPQKAPDIPRPGYFAQPSETSATNACLPQNSISALSPHSVQTESKWEEFNNFTQSGGITQDRKEEKPDIFPKNIGNKENNQYNSTRENSINESYGEASADESSVPSDHLIRHEDLVAQSNYLEGDHFSGANGQNTTGSEFSESFEPPSVPFDSVVRPPLPMAAFGRSDQRSVTGLNQLSPDQITRMALGKSQVPPFKPFDSKTPTAPHNVSQGSEIADGSGQLDNLLPTNLVVSNQFVIKSALQIHNRYLVTELPEGLAIIDQHALHERILYEKIKKGVESHEIQSQALLVPIAIDLSSTEYALITQKRDELARFGWRIELFGGHTILLNAYPALIKNTDPQDCLRDLIDLLSTEVKRLETVEVFEAIYHRMACKAAIKAGAPMSEEEIRSLLQQYAEDETLHHCPHGRPSILVYTQAELDKQFKRT